MCIIRLTNSHGVLLLGFKEVGGFDGLWTKYPKAVPNITVPNTSCHEPNPEWDVMLKDADDPDMPWPGFLLGQTPSSIWYWCSDQVNVNSHKLIGQLPSNSHQLKDPYISTVPIWPV